MHILGINAYHGDSSACILKDGKLLAAVEEERFTRVKHWAGYPRQAIEFCLKEAGISVQEVEHIAVNRNPKANIFEKVIYTLRRRPSLDLIKDRLRNAGKIGNIKSDLASHFGLDESALNSSIHHVEHHIAHMASSFYVSPFEESAIVSTDGFGDFVGAMWGVGNGSSMKIHERIYFPHSLGLFYLTITQYLGFPNYGDEYKVMGLAAYGKPVYLDEMHEIVALKDNGRFELSLDFFNHATTGISMTWENGYPEVGKAYTDHLEEALGPARRSTELIEQRHKDLAASVQAMYEEAFFHLLNHVRDLTGSPKLSLAGGTAMNSVANGKIFNKTSFEDVYIQSAAGDAGGALGAAYYVWNEILRQQRNFVMDASYWGPHYSSDEIGHIVERRMRDLGEIDARITKTDNSQELCKTVAGYIAGGAVVGWFQGKAEWGPRALGDRSILADPRRAEMKDILNARIKRRELFRPFAPSILEECTGEFFEIDYPDPFMIKVYPIKEEKRKIIPAVTHVDGTGRLQTVNRKTNPLFWHLINAFKEITGVPVLLNTSFNENEPIVTSPEEALETFLRTKMDVLVLGDFVILRNGPSTPLRMD
ncbi:MAG: carbamoyltransferase C-terminal domain-containing protein [bacterium]